MLLEVETEVQEWLSESLLGAEDHRDEQSSDATVAVQEWVDRLELGVREACLDDRRCVSLDDEFFELTEDTQKFVRRRWNEARGARTRPSNPVLRSSEFSGSLVSAATAGYKDAVCVANPSQTYRESSGDLIHCVPQR